MPFYRGDYYRGDYYRGDPFLGAAIRIGAKFIGGAARRTIAGVMRRATSRTVQTAAAAGATGYAMGQSGQPVLIAPPQGTMPGGAQIPGTGVVPYEKTDKRTKYAPGKRLRKMNPLNPRALRRALRRTEGFEKFAKRTVNALYRVIDGRKVRTFKKKAS